MNDWTSTREPESVYGYEYVYEYGGCSRRAELHRAAESRRSAPNYDAPSATLP